MRFVTLIPLQRNDGTPVAKQELDQLVEALWRRFGGVTREGEVDGCWTDPETGEDFRDRSLRVSVVCPSERIAEAMDAVAEIGRQLGQLAMYFESTTSEWCSWTPRNRDRLIGRGLVVRGRWPLIGTNRRSRA